MVFLASSLIFFRQPSVPLDTFRKGLLRSSAGHNGGSCGSVGQMGRRGGDGVMLPRPVRARKQRRAEPRAGQRKCTGFAGLCQVGLHCCGLVF